ncbi:DNA gyrase subunit B [Xenorhabdus hominickii]|uniref:DNA gyrase subunit B n=2 Tax=Xenorhabdus hominickii TaxID=351679 RepID=A0A2G0QG44_XENHO|nr:DNA gyrase subunit B [Xenorhabdus hominickii]PHM58205.1 DNA gyrase subunit B [Xenorhabdus hominickii]
MLIAWPFLVWAMVNYGQFHAMLAVIILFFVLRLLSSKHQTRSQQNSGFNAGWILSIIGIALGLASLFLRSHQLLMYYPVAVNVILLILFGSSLRYGPSIIERMARFKEPDLPPEGIVYTRKVTYIWCLFFIFNGAVALGTCLYNDMTLWTLWNGMVSYLLIGLLITIEWLVRQRVKKR